MQTPEIPADEATRIEALHALQILDTRPEERFDRLTRLARRLFGVPVALVNFIDTDRQWFKSHSGITVTETPRDISFCGHAILGDGIFVIRDTSLDVRFHDNPLVAGSPGVRFYAGCPLNGGNGHRVGTLCIIDHAPRDFTEDDMTLLRDLARMVEQELVAFQLATMDELTALSNRRGFHALAQPALSLCRRLHKPASLLFFDLDMFKQINDRFGHSEGDRALVSFARLLKENFRDSDVVSRLGGDEFAVLTTNLDARELARAVERMAIAVEKHNLTAQRGYGLRYSVGAVQLDAARHHGIAELVAEADALMYENKQQQVRSRGGRQAA